MNFYKEITLKSFVLTVLCLVIISCSSNDEHLRYIAAKLVNSDKWSIVDVKTGDILYKDEFYSQPSFISDGKFCVKNENGLYDYFSVDNVTKPINKESYLCASLFIDGIAFVVLPGKGISIINERCETIAELDDSIIALGGVGNGCIEFLSKNDRYGFINGKGEIIIEPRYDYILANFSEDHRAIVSNPNNDYYEVIDDKGSTLYSLPYNHNEIYGGFQEGYLTCLKENNEIVLLNKWNEVCSFGKWESEDLSKTGWPKVNNGIIVFKEGDLFGLKDTKGHVVMRAKYDCLAPADHINTLYYYAEKNGLAGYIDIDDNIIIPLEYNKTVFLRPDMLIVEDNKTLALMDMNLKKISPDRFTNISLFRGPSIISNKFDVNKEMEIFTSAITDTTFFGTNPKTTFGDLRYLAYKEPPLHQCLKDKFLTFDLTYWFNEDIVICNLINGIFNTQYNYGARIEEVRAVKSYAKFQPGTEEIIARSFDKFIQNKNFKRINNQEDWFINEDSGMTIGLSFDEGVVTIRCRYLPFKYWEKLKRNPRKEYSNPDKGYDYFDTFGYETESPKDEYD